MAERVSVLLVGIGGYGGRYADALLDRGEENGISLAGVVDLTPEKYGRIEELRAGKIPLHGKMEDFYARKRANLAVIATPIQFHAAQACLALDHGSHVLCEKPLSATIQEALGLAEHRDRAGRFAAIGYQWSFGPAIQALKRDIMAGRFGRAKRLKTLVLWPRSTRYFGRSWAGKKRDREGRWILDSIANNAAAHFLHNMFYVLGGCLDRSAGLRQVTAELYRANAIENFDTAAIRAITSEGVETLFLATHATPTTVGPNLCYEFERATILYESESSGGPSELRALLSDGTCHVYGDPTPDHAVKLWTCLEAVRGQADIPCGIEAAIAQTVCVNAAQESRPAIVDFPGNCCASALIPGRARKSSTWTAWRKSLWIVIGTGVSRAKGMGKRPGPGRAVPLTSRITGISAGDGQA